jgi:DedD protein
MSLLSSNSKDKQEPAPDDGAFYSRAEEESNAVRKRSSKRRSSGSGSQPVDPVLPEKKRARRRLIGAVALVLAAIIGLPMVLDSEPRPVADDIAIQIPSKDKASSSATPVPAARASGQGQADAAGSLDPKEEVIDPPAASGSVFPVNPSSSSAATTPADKSGAGKGDKSPGASSAKPAAKHDTPKPAEKKSDPQAKADATAQPKPDTKTAETKATEKKSDEAARAKALLEGKLDPAADKKPTRVAVQVAALSSQEKIDELLGKLKAGGIKAYVQKVPTEAGERTRIRVGPFASKEEAEKVREKIIKLGLSGNIVPA